MGPAPVLTDVDTKEPDLLTLSTVVLLMEMESVSCNLLFPLVNNKSFVLLTTTTEVRVT